MESKSKKKLLNGIMVLLILVIFASGIITVGMIQGWFGGKADPIIMSSKVKGVVNIERNGIGYTLKSDTAINSGDNVETKKGAEAEFSLAKNSSFVMNGNSQVQITIGEENAVQVEVRQGEVFGDTFAYGDSFEVIFGENKAQLSEAVFSVSVQAGSQTLQVYEGDVSVELADGTKERVEAGEALASVSDTDGNITSSVQAVSIVSLNQFLITQCQNCVNAAELCFSGEELQKVLDDRAAEKQAALEASLRAEIVIQKEEESEEETDKQETNITEIQEEETTEIVEEYVPEEDINICTITIVCDTILDNLENLDDGKEAYVPENGCILDTSSVEFEDGETVFDVLTRVCEYAGIQLEYSWTPMYNSYYVEGINNLYEFDCGNESGWMYKVNGWFPNYGCSSYMLEDGDAIVWCYTCNGLGADVGGKAY